MHYLMMPDVKIQFTIWILAEITTFSSLWRLLGIVAAGARNDVIEMIYSFKLSNEFSQKKISKTVKLVQRNLQVIFFLKSDVMGFGSIKCQNKPPRKPHT